MKPTLQGRPEITPKPHAVRRLSPLLATMMVGAALISTPARSDAEGAADKCSATMQRGSFGPLTSKTAKGRLVNSPLMVEGTYLSLAMPISYVDKLNAASDPLSAEARRDMLTDTILRNQELALQRIGNSSRVSFDCVPIDQPVAQPPVKTAPSPPAVTAPPNAAPAPSVAAPRPGPAFELPPLPSQVKGGNGSSASPYMVYATAPYPGKERTIEFPITMSIEKIGLVKFKILFRASQLTASHKQETLGELRGIFSGAIKRFAAEAKSPVENTALRSALNQLPESIENGLRQIDANDPELSNYLRNN